MYSRYLQYISLSLSLSLRGCGVVGPYAVVAWARSMMTHVRHFERPLGNAREYFEYEHDVDYFPHEANLYDGDPAGCRDLLDALVDAPTNRLYKTKTNVQ